MLGQIVVDDERVHAIVSEKLAHGAARVWGQVLERGSVGGRSADDDGVLHGVSVRKALHNLGDGGSLLANGDVDAEELLLVVFALHPSLLVDDRVNGNGSLASLSIADDQLTLASADGHKRVDGLDARQHGLAHTDTRDNARSLHADTSTLGRLDGALAVNGVTEGVHDAAEQLIANWHVDDGSRSLDNVTLLDQLVVTEDDNTDVVGLQVESHALRKEKDMFR